MPELSSESVGRPDHAQTGFRRMDLATRLSFTIAAILILGLLMSVALVIQQSRRSVEREVGSELDFAVSAIEGALADGADDRMLRDLARHLDTARHLCVSTGDEPIELACPDNRALDVPDWFQRWVAPARPQQTRTFGSGAQAWTLTLVADPADEMAEAWSDARGLLLMLVGTTIAIQILGFALVSRGLKPVSAIVEALARLRDGDLSEPARKLTEKAGARDLLSIAEGVDALRARLATTCADNHRLLQRCLETQEEERVHLARELHDDMGQSLTAVEVEIMVARSVIQSGGGDADASLDAAAVNARSALVSLRRVLHELRPGGLDHVGLSLALRQLVDDWQRRLPDVCFVCDVDDSVCVDDATTALHLYRVAQEAMTNVARHADASEVLLRLHRGDDGLQLTVADNGRGLPSTSQRRGLGLVGMRERAEAMRASLRIDSRPKRGCRIDICIAKA
ncbi:histidine kinase [Hydrocarboniphaga effusa]|jgi:two-component system sensor histidine kinase UhpB|uniref:histidine kinase n=1 Tax=Hydrocarboniphaga effusa TaxID=243629 RepID=UPI003137FD61